MYAMNVIFEIKIDTDLDNIIFVDISSYSMIPSEEEVLFDLGTIFKIENVEYRSTINEWIVSLIGTKENELLINDYIKIKREELKKKRKILQKEFLILKRENFIEGEFGSLLIDMGLYSKAIRYLENLLIKTTSIENKIVIYYWLATSYFRNKEYQLASKNAINSYDLCIQFNSNSLILSSILKLLGHIHGKQILNHNLAKDYYEKSYEKIDFNNNEYLSEKYDIMGHLYMSQFKYSEGIKYYKATVGIDEKFYALDHPDIAHKYYKIGYAYFYEYNFNMALEYATKALEIQNKILPDNHPDLSVSYWLMGQICRKQSKYELAVQTYIKALALKQMLNPGDYFEIAGIYEYIGYCCDRKKDYDMSIEYYTKAIKMYNKLFPAFKIVVANIQFDIAWLYFIKGNHDLAIEYLNESLLTNEKKDIISIVTSFYLFGLCYDKKNEYYSAMMYYKKLLEYYEEQPSHKKSALLNIYQKIGRLYQYIGDYNLSIEYYNKAAIIEENMIPREPIVRASINENIGRCYQTIEEYDKSIEKCKSALEIYKNCSILDIPCSETIPQEHPMVDRIISDFYTREEYLYPDIQIEIMYLYKNIGYCYIRKEVLDLSLKYNLKFLELYEKYSSLDDLLVAQTHEDLAWIFEKYQHYQSAIEHYEKARSIRQNIVPIDELMIATLYHTISWKYYHLNNYNVAIQNCVKSVDLYKKLSETCCLEYANALNSLGHMYYTVNNNKEAFENCTKSMKIYIDNNVSFDDHTAIADNFEALGNIHFINGDQTIAFDYYLKSLALLSRTNPINHKDMERVKSFLNNINEIEF
ncbi:unnamed protein product [Rotaria sordida]|uniref:Tetratricopeptide repeat protein n=1 Tax=Rotaria sordida TaxID=392033 RepID=A0A815JRD0_9BILA|nr:unnamed protein product [Rotaria sordida]CAF3960208.1 unnamed protein product [Rotaria sordida]